MVAHPTTSAVRSVRRYRSRWVIALSCGHTVRVSATMSKPAIGAVFTCPERPIGVVLVDDLTGEETPYDPFVKTGSGG